LLFDWQFPFFQGRRVRESKELQLGKDSRGIVYRYPKGEENNPKTDLWKGGEFKRFCGHKLRLPSAAIVFMG